MIELPTRGMKLSKLRKILGNDPDLEKLLRLFPNQKSFEKMYYILRVLNEENYIKKGYTIEELSKKVGLYGMIPLVYIIKLYKFGLIDVKDESLRFNKIYKIDINNLLEFEKHLDNIIEFINYMKSNNINILEISAHKYYYGEIKETYKDLRKNLFKKYENIVSVEQMRNILLNNKYDPLALYLLLNLFIHLGILKDISSIKYKRQLPIRIEVNNRGIYIYQKLREIEKIEGNYKNVSYLDEYAKVIAYLILKGIKENKGSVITIYTPNKIKEIEKYFGKNISIHLFLHYLLILSEHGLIKKYNRSRPIYQINKDDPLYIVGRECLQKNLDEAVLCLSNYIKNYLKDFTK